MNYENTNSVDQQQDHEVEIDDSMDMEKFIESLTSIMSYFFPVKKTDIMKHNENNTKTITTYTLNPVLDCPQSLFDGMIQKELRNVIRTVYSNSLSFILDTSDISMPTSTIRNMWHSPQDIILTWIQQMYNKNNINHAFIINDTALKLLDFIDPNCKTEIYKNSNFYKLDSSITQGIFYNVHTQANLFVADDSYFVDEIQTEPTQSSYTDNEHIVIKNDMIRLCYISHGYKFDVDYPRESLYSYIIDNDMTYTSSNVHMLNVSNTRQTKQYKHEFSINSCLRHNVNPFTSTEDLTNNDCVAIEWVLLPKISDYVKQQIQFAKVV